MLNDKTASTTAKGVMPDGSLVNLGAVPGPPILTAQGPRVAIHSATERVKAQGECRNDDPFRSAPLLYFGPSGKRHWDVSNASLVKVMATAIAMILVGWLFLLLMNGCSSPDPTAVMTQAVVGFPPLKGER